MKFEKAKTLADRWMLPKRGPEIFLDMTEARLCGYSPLQSDFTDKPCCLVRISEMMAGLFSFETYRVWVKD